VEALEDCRDAMWPDPVELDVLADSNIGQSAPMLIGKISDGIQLFRSQVATRYSDPNHEEAINSRPLGIEPMASEMREDIRGDRFRRGVGPAMEIGYNIRQEAGLYITTAHE
jgi:hypothetical protein